MADDPRQVIAEAMLNRPPEMRAYEPSWRDRIAAWMLGDERPSQARRAAVEGLMGSTGLGNAGAGVVDFTPAGMALSANEFQRAGSFGEAAAAALGLIPAARPAAAEAKLLASRSPHLYDPPARPARPFSEDYRVHPDYSGRLKIDIDGRSIDPGAVIVGRRMVGGEDQALSAAQLDAATEAVTGSRIEVVSQGHARRPEFDRNGWLGLTVLDRQTGLPKQVLLHSDAISDADTARRLTGHEFGHVVEAASLPKVGIDTTQIEWPVRRIYNDLNNPNPKYREIESYRGPTKPLPEYVVSPETRGYYPHQVDAELVADAVRAYVSDPNYIKTDAPKVAAAIREAWNTNPELRKIVHFNSLLGALFMLGGKQETPQ